MHADKKLQVVLSAQNGRMERTSSTRYVEDCGEQYQRAYIWLCCEEAKGSRA